MSYNASLNMNSNKNLFSLKNIKVFITQCVLQIIYAIFLVVTLIWGLTQIAIFNSEKPKVVVYNTMGKETLLKVYKANVIGDLKFDSMLLENQKSGFDYMYGRELMKERQNRVVSSWNNKKASLQWYVCFDQKVDLKLKIIGEQTTNNKNVVNLYLNDKLLPIKKVNSTNKKTFYNTILNIEKPGTYKIELKVNDISDTENFQFKSISLKPKIK